MHCSLDLSIEHLNSLGFSNVPPHRLKLCVGMLCMMLRNLDSSNRLMNGTRVMIKSIGVRLIEVIRAEDLGNVDKPPSFLIPRIIITPQARILRCRQSPIPDYVPI